MEVVLIGQNKVITQIKILGETTTPQGITWRFLLPGMLNRLLPDPIILQMVTTNSGGKIPKKQVPEGTRTVNGSDKL